MRKVKGWWKSFLDRLTKTAEEEFSNKPLECCDLSSESERNRSHNTQRKAS